MTPGDYHKATFVLLALEPKARRGMTTTVALWSFMTSSVLLVALFLPLLLGWRVETTQLLYGHSAALGFLITDDYILTSFTHIHHS